MTMERRDYGLLPDGRAVHEYTLDNGRGLKLTAITLGGIVTGAGGGNPPQRLN